MAYQMERREAPLPHQFVVDMGAAKQLMVLHLPTVAT